MKPTTWRHSPNLHALVGLCSILLVAMSMLRSDPAVAEESMSEQYWGEWQPLSGGYVARRRVPPNVDLPVQQRRLETTQQRSLVSPGQAASATGAALDPRRSPGRPGSSISSITDSVSISSTTDSVWLQTDEPGLYRVSVAELAAETGLGVNQIRRFARNGGISLLNEEAPVAWHFDQQSDSIWFAGERYETFYSDLNAYQLRLVAGSDQQRMREQRGRGGAGMAVPSPFRDTIRFEEEPDMFFNMWVAAAEPDADYWFWDYLWGGHRDEIEVVLHLPAPAVDGVGELRVQLRGWTDLYPGDEHQVYAELNGEPVGSVVTWDGFAAVELVAEFDQVLLYPDGDNIFTLRNSYAPGTSPGQFLDAIEVDYLRLPVADNGKLWLRGVTAGVQAVSGFDSEDVLVIESPVRDAILRNDARVYHDGDSWAVAFEARDGADFLVVEAAAIRTPGLDVLATADLNNQANQADYLIIAPRDFAGTAEALAQHRRASFGSVRTVWLDDIYKVFGAGREDPFAIGRFMQTIMSDWQQAPSMVMLLGKGSLDHKDRMGYGDSFLPVVMTSNPWSLAASDARLVGFEDGNTPFGLGRLPITNDAEGLSYVNKLIEHEQLGQGWMSAVLVADNPDEAGDFHANSEDMSWLLLDLGFHETRPLYHPQHRVRAELTRSSTWDQAAYITYAGHGSVGQLGSHAERFITAADAARLNNELFPVFTALTCATGDDSLPATRSLTAALVLNPRGGAIASLAPTGLSLDADAHVLGMAFADSLFGGDNTIGGAVAEAKQWTHGSIRGFMSPMYSVVGDPAVRVH